MSPRGKDQNIILYIARTPSFGKSVEQMKKRHGKKYRFALLYQEKAKTKRQEVLLDSFDITLRCNFDTPKTIAKTILPYQNDLLAVTCRSDSNIPLFQKVIPHVPYLRTPTTESLTWATNKLQMRRRFALYKRSITPRYRVVHDTAKKTLKQIEENVGFPLIIKPTGLATSLLVSPAYHREELESSLKRVFRKINKLHRKQKGRGEANVLVEQYIDGDMYSVDGYVTSRGKIYFTPFCRVKTGRDVGYDDFFAYQTITPTRLNKQSVADAQAASAAGVHALGLRSTTVHVELLKTEDGWKIIEIGPRVGGFRDIMYRLSYGIDHASNDFFIRIPRKPEIPRKTLGHTAVLKFFAKKEGRITRIGGIKKAKEMKSFYDIKTHKKVGDRAVFAKHGGESIVTIHLFNKERSQLLADMRRLEKTIDIRTA